ncbi:PREDICTED: uncharacterized protein LOC109154712 [Ipomoea nil]|uniref:uncharacterized protein LOC109154712 n=1 Tax=Ipomoea nil TaxID=35883 RepID=UPI000900D5D4|nr:PREDICTED: uncharacterized protein LOC109154712 [Ipomoea nil]
MAKAEIDSNPGIEIKMRLIGKRTKDARTYNLPTTSEVAALIVGDLDPNMGQRDILVESKSGLLKRISELSPSYLPLQYPVLFPYGEDGYREDIQFANRGSNNNNARHRISQREYFAYTLHERLIETSSILYARRLLQQFIVDAYTMVESARLIYIRTHQKSLRCEALKGLTDAFTRGEVHASTQEIQRYISNRNLNAEDRPDILCRIFKMKLDCLIKEVKAGELFGHVKAVIYTIEFQKRGLPHAHILIFLKNKGDMMSTTFMDRVIKAEVPDKTVDVEYYNAVEEFMVHGPCGNARRNSPCMVNGKCSKHFPKRFVEESSFDQDGYPIYMRCDDGRTVKKNGVELDSRYIFSHNRYLLLQYKAHINVEWCNQSRSIKYLFKYVNKGNDRVTAEFYKSTTDENGEEVVDEINTYYDCRETVGQSMFKGWFEANKKYEAARLLTYIEMPNKFVWKKEVREWHPRKKGFSVGRIFFVPPGSGEIYYLRCLLNIVRGPTSFKDIMTFNGVEYLAFRDACYARGLLDDDKEYIDAIEEASHWSSAHVIRKLFVILLISNSLSRPEHVWEAVWHHLAEDAEFMHRKQLNKPDLFLKDCEKKSFALIELEKLLIVHNKSLKHFPPMPTPNIDDSRLVENILLFEELNYDREALRADSEELESRLTDEQRDIYNTIVNDLSNDGGGLFFVYGYGGTGKTFL